MREIHWTHVFIVKIFDREVGQKSSVSELMASEVDFLAERVVVNVVLSPFFLPCLGLKGNWEGASHLDCFADRKVRSGFVVEESKSLIVKVD